VALGLLTTTMLVAPGVALAQNAHQAEPAVLDEVVVTATGVAVDIRDAPASVSVITREDIARQPVQNIGQLLSRIPGVSGGWLTVSCRP